MSDTYKVSAHYGDGRNDGLSVENVYRKRAKSVGLRVARNGRRVENGVYSHGHEAYRSNAVARLAMP